MAKHLPIGGSTAARTLACPAWLERSKNLPPQKSNVYADEGNLLHDAMEEHYMNFTPFADLVGQLTYAEQVLTAEHVKDLLNPARDCVDEVFDRYSIEEYTCEPFVEIVKGEAGGSIDMLGVSNDGKFVLVLDYKFGSGRVIAKDNKQLQFYGLAAKTDAKTRRFFDKAQNIVYCIVQPKLAYVPQVWVSPVSQLDEFKTQLHDAMVNRYRAEPGTHCKYCPVYNTCPDRNEPKRKSYEEILQKIVDNK